MGTPLRIYVSEEEAEADRLEQLARQLREELLLLEADDIEDVVPLATGGPAPPGSRAVGVVEIGALLVTLSKSAGALRDIIGLLRSWRGRRASRPTIRLELGGDVLEISEATEEQVAGTYELFISRHAARSQGGEKGPG
ncbi:hypothetical protein [Streptomyces aidingensis]|uniref:Uncharacterized protein n=1 Tax=Streptomyces aidingensis TaxID=910347 RepID=A0A1I1NY51_9ACTN|nr:hypothetical protein [Streptomyces aidingensis]SFD02336.1 hypothetical protein SAMN05421773_108223 [Streptomyces aidingensis]